jgi:3-phosphoshikimate 1-carboxyvinyltransferase
MAGSGSRYNLLAAGDWQGGEPIQKGPMDIDTEDHPERSGWTTETRIRDEILPPGSKSLGQRALLAAGLSRGATRLLGLAGGADIEACLDLLRDGGLVVEGVPPGPVLIHGRPPGEWRACGPLQLGESGTLARCATAFLALSTPAGSRFDLQARGSLVQRESAPLVACLRAAGATIEPASPRGTWPLTLTSSRAPERLCLEEPISSQEFTALALALASLEGTHRLEVRGTLPSLPYVAMTCAVLAQFGAELEAQGSSFEICGPLRAPGAPVSIEPDASAAAVALAAACLAGSATRIGGFGEASSQGDLAIVDHLVAFGCRAELSGGVLSATGRPLRGVDLDLTGEPDLAPVLLALAGAVALEDQAAGATSRFCGLGTLNGKECRRLDVLAAALTRLGLAVRCGTDWLEVGPGSPTSDPLDLDPHGDHRMAFAFALLGLVRPGILVTHPGCVAKSWPGFWRDCTLPTSDAPAP